MALYITDGNGVPVKIAGSNDMYPIDSIYLSVSPTSPASIFGGTWEQILGKFLLSSDDVLTDGTITTAGSYHVGDTGGSANAVVVSHNHEFYQGVTNSGGTYTDNAKHLWDIASSHGGGWGQRSALFTGDNEQGVQSTGVDGTGKNMPPYLVVYMWKRVA